MTQENHIKLITAQTVLMSAVSGVCGLLQLAYLQKITIVYADDKEVLMRIIFLAFIDRMERLFCRCYYASFAQRQKQMLAYDYHTSASRQAVQLFVTGVVLSLAYSLIIVSTCFSMIRDVSTRYISVYLFVVQPIVLLVRGLACDLWRYEMLPASTSLLYFFFFALFTFFMAFFYYRAGHQAPAANLAFFLMRFPSDAMLAVVGIFSRFHPDAMVKFDFRQWFPLNYTTIVRFCTSTLAQTFNGTFSYIQIFITYVIELHCDFYRPFDIRVVLYQQFTFIEILKLCNAILEAFIEAFILDQNHTTAQANLQSSTPDTGAQKTMAQKTAIKRLCTQLLCSYLFDAFGVYCFWLLLEPTASLVLGRYYGPVLGTIIIPYLISQAIRPLKRVICAHMVWQDNSLTSLVIEMCGLLVTGVVHYFTRSQGQFLHPIQLCLYADCFRQAMYVFVYVIDFIYNVVVKYKATKAAKTKQ